MKCPSCSKEMPDERQSCPFCGTALGDSFTPTQLLPDAPDDKVKKRNGRERAPSSSESAPSTSFDTSGGGRFVPGTMLGERYRIGDFIGRGGMGEVYRADDLKLGQPVALKFLPEHLLNDGAALARFHREVRVARQVSHRNVCRVYDIGEVEGQHFLSMEYIKGQELATLLKSIGHLSRERAVQLARQLCAGLSAAHETGVLHRDLKPANVMIDADGNARITDFGLAGLAEEFRAEELRAGTPTYMAPEQLAGKGVTQRSDIYALGLVLYEIFTGRKAYDPRTFDELRRIHESDTTPTSPSSLVKDIDPLVERVILRCLEKDPDKRPASALQVAAALPGGDPLQAALAAGETPSPEMVAAAPKQGSLRPAVAVTLFACVLLLLGLLMLFSKQVDLIHMVPLEKSPEVLEERAGEMLKKLGYNAPPTDTVYGFSIDEEFLRYINEHDASRTRWDKLATGQPSAVRFWYRQSPRYFVASGAGTVTNTDPPNEISGMLSMSLDTQGHLFHFDVVPPQLDEAQDPAQQQQSPDWSILFDQAGLNQADFEPTESKWTPPHAYDERMAWNGIYPNVPDFPIRVEAASYRGKPVYFEIVSPWRRPSLQAPYQESKLEIAGTVGLLTTFFAIILVAAWLALKNIRLGRGDRRGAFRLALFIFALRMLYWAIAKHHVPTAGEFMVLLTSLQSALFWACFAGLMYLALEPFLRKRWPERVIAWNRLLAGEFRDPLVGRDILIGAVIGLCCVLLSFMEDLVPRWMGMPPNIPNTPANPDSAALMGMRGFLPLLINQVSAAVVQSFLMVFPLLFLTMLLRRKWLGIVAGWLILSAIFALATIAGKPLIVWPFNFLLIALFIMATTRFGPLALISAVLFFHLQVFFPITTHLTAWYAGDFVLDLIFLIFVAAYGFYISLAGQPLLRGALLED